MLVLVAVGDALEDGEEGREGAVPVEVRLGSGRRAHGRVVAADGTPLPGMRVAVVEEYFALLSTVVISGADGSFDDLPQSVVTPTGPKVERRAWVRHELDVGSCGIIDPNVFCGSPESEEFWPLVIRDLSVGGVGVLVARRFELGTELSIELSVGPDVPPRRLLAKVVRIVPEKAGHWTHG